MAANELQDAMQAGGMFILNSPNPGEGLFLSGWGFRTTLRSVAPGIFALDLDQPLRFWIEPGPPALGRTNALCMTNVIESAAPCFAGAAIAPDPAPDAGQLTVSLTDAAGDPFTGQATIFALVVKIPGTEPPDPP